MLVICRITWILEFLSFTSLSILGFFRWEDTWAWIDACESSCSHSGKSPATSVIHCIDSNRPCSSTTYTHKHTQHCTWHCHLVDSSPPPPPPPVNPVHNEPQCHNQRRRTTVAGIFSLCVSLRAAGCGNSNEWCWQWPHVKVALHDKTVALVCST